VPPPNDKVTDSRPPGRAGLGSGSAATRRPGNGDAGWLFGAPPGYAIPQDNPATLRLRRPSQNAARATLEKLDRRSGSPRGFGTERGLGALGKATESSFPFDRLRAGCPESMVTSSATAQSKAQRAGRASTPFRTDPCPQPDRSRGSVYSHNDQAHRRGRSVTLKLSSAVARPRSVKRSCSAFISVAIESGLPEFRER